MARWARGLRQQYFCHHDSLAFNDRDAAVIDIHQQRDSQADNQIDRHGHGYRLDGLPRLVQHGASKQRNHIGIANSGGKRGVLTMLRYWLVNGGIITAVPGE